MNEKNENLHFKIYFQKDNNQEKKHFCSELKKRRGREKNEREGWKDRRWEERGEKDEKFRIIYCICICG